jgi:nucleotide-binding universal stress UspA family protein
MYRSILVPTDGSACSESAELHAVALAGTEGSSVVFLFVMDTLRNYHEGVMTDVLRTLKEEGDRALARARHIAASARVEASAELAEGDPAEVIWQRAAEFDLVVMGSHGKGLWKRLTLGSVTQTVLHHITSPLLVIPGGRATTSD